MRVGFVGLGTMGKGVVARLLKAGYSLTINDLNESAAQEHLGQAAVWASTPSEVAARSDVIFLSLPGPTEVRQVVLGENGLSGAIQPGTVVFDLSTNSPRTVREIHATLAEQNVFFLDAPVSGGPHGAAAGQLAVWVSGDETVVSQHTSILEAMATDIQYLGSIGAASVAKLVHNCVGYIFNSAMAEVFSMGVKAGVDAEKLFSALRSGAIGRRRSFDSLANHFLTNNYDPPKFALRLAHKDVALALNVGDEVGVPMPMAQLTLQQMNSAIERGWGNRDSRVAMRLIQELAGVDVYCEPDVLRTIMDDTKR